MKGIAGLVIALIIITGIIVGGVISYESIKLTKNSVGYTIMLDEGKLMEAQAHYDADKQFLGNALWLSGVNSLYENGLNGGLDKDSTEYNTWGKCEGYVCWSKDNYPSKDDVASQLGSRINETYKGWFDNFASDLDVKVNRYLDDPTPKIKMDYTNSKIKLSYEANLFSSNKYQGDESLNQTIEGNEKIETDIPTKYFILYDKAKNFVNNINDLKSELKDVLDYVKVCGSEGGTLSENEAKNKIQSKLNEIANGKNDNNIEWELKLVKMNLLNMGFNNYKASFVISVSVIDKSTKIPTPDGMKKLALTFGIEDTMSFTRIVENVCESAIDSKCDIDYPVNACSGGLCNYWVKKEKANCQSGQSCYCEYQQSCNCGIDKCENENGCIVTPYRIIFVTSEVYNGSLGGLSGADAKCQELASNAGLSGTFVALLSDSNTDARNRISNCYLKNTHGDVISTDCDDLWDGSIENAINYDENGNLIANGYYVWTGSNKTGQYEENNSCRDWTSDKDGWTTGDDEDFGHLGLSNENSFNWVDIISSGCNNKNRLYCVQTG
ncbi:MAG: hypothetical protein J7K87_03300 [Candidatus Aenigmarchaeota archaeon]|nr:hypothetical protein [Candidatus Aenigmarchaeota archaeon]